VAVAATAAFAAGALVFSRDGERSRTTARAEIRSSAEAKTIRPRTTEPRRRPRRRPQQRGTTDFADIDVTDVDPSRLMVKAQRAAGKLVPDAELVMFAANGVQNDGHVDATTPGHVVQWLFRSKSGKQCALLLVNQAGITLQTTKGPSCVGPNVGLPKCTIEEVIAKTMGGGSVRVLTAKAGHVTFIGNREDADAPIWNVQVGPLGRTNIPDDCGADAGP
jgi:hypothetical protein